MNKFFFVLCMSALLYGTEYDRFVSKALEIASRQVNFTRGQDVQEEIDALNKFLYKDIIRFYGKTKTESGKKFIKLIGTYIFGNLIAVYMIQQSIVLEANKEFREDRAFLQELLTDMHLLRSLAKDYKVPTAAEYSETSIAKLIETLQKIKPVTQEESKKLENDLIDLDILGLRFRNLARGPIDFKKKIEQFDLITFGKNLAGELRKKIAEQIKNDDIPLDISEENLEQFISLINSLLRFKTFLQEGAALKLRNNLYRFIQLYPVFLIIDQLKPTLGMYDVLDEMQNKSRELQKLFAKEEILLRDQMHRTQNPLARSIHANNIELITSFNKLLTVVNDALLNIGLQIFTKDLQVVTSLF